MSSRNLLLVSVTAILLVALSSGAATGSESGFPAVQISEGAATSAGYSPPAVENPFRKNTALADATEQNAGHVAPAMHYESQPGSQFPPHDELRAYAAPEWNYGPAAWDTGPHFAYGGPGCSCDSCCQPIRPPQVWAEADYLLWWTKAARVPPLATTSPPGTPATAAGVLGEPGTQVVFGDSRLLDDAHSGGRFQLGMWIDDCHEEGVAVTYLFLGRQSDSFSASQADFAILARPFFDVVADAEDARLIAFPGLVQGRLTARASERLQSVTLEQRTAAARSPYGRIDYLVGYRFAELRDDIFIHDTTLGLSGPTAGLGFDVFDAFETQNLFHGFDLGLEMQQVVDCLWSYSLQGRVALGATRSRTRIAGQTTVSDDEVVTTTPGGLLALGTNIGHHGETNFGTLSEAGVSVRRKLSDRTALTFGYNVLYWSKVLRAADQIDLEINPTQIPPGVLEGEARPAFPAAASSYWAQGLRLGFEAAF